MKFKKSILLMSSVISLSMAGVFAGQQALVSAKSTYTNGTPKVLQNKKWQGKFVKYQVKMSGVKTYKARGRYTFYFYPNKIVEHFEINNPSNTQHVDNVYTSKNVKFKKNHNTYIFSLNTYQGNTHLGHSAPSFVLYNKHHLYYTMNDTDTKDMNAQAKHLGDLYAK